MVAVCLLSADDSNLICPQVNLNRIRTLHTAFSLDSMGAWWDAPKFLHQRYAWVSHPEKNYTSMVGSYVAVAGPPVLLQCALQASCTTATTLKLWYLMCCC
ncbi:hypothetical protein PAHAL_2G147500 [Panicum hallii]|uniref:Uncharacterized protein n=1 Tax=Panicum hallii TaxID=206008 RepID=A0A2T8KP84_9POAL|nr:hypothetical protein PAHAL_2G147500 [Panicum hallii]